MLRLASNVVQFIQLRWFDRVCGAGKLLMVMVCLCVLSNVTRVIRAFVPGSRLRVLTLLH